MEDWKQNVEEEFYPQENQIKEFFHKEQKRLDKEIFASKVALGIGCGVALLETLGLMLLGAVVWQLIQRLW